MARELKSIGDEESRAAWQSKQADLEVQFRERLKGEYDREISATERGFAGVDARRAIRRRFRQRGYEPEAPETGVERMSRERQEWEAHNSRQPRRLGVRRLPESCWRSIGA